MPATMPPSQPQAEPPPPALAKRTAVYDLENAVIKATTVISLLRERVINTINEDQTEGICSDYVAMGIAEMGSEAMEELRETFNKAFDVVLPL
jgi:hypothetical protein